MRLTMLGGGGFRTPLVYGALLRDHSPGRVTEVVLHDTDEVRLTAIRQVLARQASAYAAAQPDRSDLPDPPRVTVTTDLDRALGGADFVFSAIRVGGLSGRVADERVALDHGLLGQETTGPGGLAYALRTVPVAVDIAERTRRLAPDAWVINFTNPAGLVTQAMRAVLGERVIGICDSPLGLARRAARVLGRGLDGLTVDYAGLNHLGWLTGLRDESGRDVLPDLLAEPTLLGRTEEGGLFGPEWLADLGMLPNEYLYYYYFTRDAVRAVAAGPTRGEQLAEQQATFYAEAAVAGKGAYAVWERARRARDESYLAELRTEERDELDVAGGGYEGVALALMAAISRGEPATLILNVDAGPDGGGALPGLPAGSVVELPCRVDGAGPVPLPVTPLSGHALGLVQQAKEVDGLVIRSALERSPRLAVEAFALHPLVDSVTVARELAPAYGAAHPELAWLR